MPAFREGISLRVTAALSKGFGATEIPGLPFFALAGFEKRAAKGLVAPAEVACSAQTVFSTGKVG